MDDTEINQKGSMKEYLAHVAKERTSLSLTLRRYVRPSIAAIRANSILTKKQRSPLIENEICPYLTPEGAVECINSNNISQIVEMAAVIENCATTNQRLLDKLVCSEELAIEIVQSLTNDSIQENFRVHVMEIICSLFSASNIISENYVDNGLTMSIIELIQSDSTTLVTASLTLIRQISGVAYVKDSMITFGIPDYLLEKIGSTEDPSIIEDICVAICTIFHNVDEVDSTILEDYISKLAPLLDLDNVNAVKAIITAYVSITDQQPMLIHNCYDCGIPLKTMELLQNEHLVGACLILLANFCHFHPKQVITLLQAGLLDILAQFAQTNHAGGSFSILSNLIESITNEVIDFCYNLIPYALQLTQSCSFETKKEISYFICTFIMFSTSTVIKTVLHEDILELIIEMLGCSIPIIINRCLDSIQKLATVMDADTLEISPETIEDLISALEELTRSGTKHIAHYSTHILTHLQSLKL